MVVKTVFVDDIHHLPKDLSPSVACIGYFDGVHRGHQALINKTHEISSSMGLRPCLISFDPDPWSVLRNTTSVNHITPMEEKKRIVNMYGIDTMIIIKFSQEVAQLSPADFVEKLLLPLNVKSLVCGSDYRFGYKGAGTPAMIQQLYESVLPCTVINLLSDALGKIGSTHIIQRILKGDMEQAGLELGREYCLSGKVVHGRKQGRRIGFPTANLELIGEYVIPKPGVYAGYTRVNDKVYRSIINIGTNPTFNTLDTIAIETHILDFSDDIYDTIITQSFSLRIRDELKFETIDALIEQMKDDERIARLTLNRLDSVVF